MINNVKPGYVNPLTMVGSSKNKQAKPLYLEGIETGLQTITEISGCSMSPFIHAVIALSIAFAKITHKSKSSTGQSDENRICMCCFFYYIKISGQDCDIVHAGNRSEKA